MQVDGVQFSHRAVIFRMYPGTRSKHDQLSRIAGACRFVWNEAITHNRKQYEAACLMNQCPGVDIPMPSVTFFSMGKWFTKLRNGQKMSSRCRQETWLQELHMATVRHTLKHQADAWQRFFRGVGNRPRYHGKCGDDSFTIPENVRLSGESIWVPRVGWFKLSRQGGNPYADYKPVKAVVKRQLGKWYCIVTYEVPDDRVDNGLALGVDMNVGQVAVSTGEIHRMPDVRRLEARKKRYQRMMARRVKGSNRRAKAQHLCAKAQRRIASVRSNWHHQASRILANTAGTVVIEDLKTKNMTASAKGTLEQPGRNVSAKAGLNREVLKTGWSAMRQNLEYKAANVIAVNPAYTSQTCHACGHVSKDSRKTQSEFECAHCGHTGNADVNAALNILASGIGVTGRGGALALVTPVIRQNINSGRAAQAVNFH